MTDRREPVVLVTGVTGQVGAELLLRLRNDIRAVGVDRNQLDLSDLGQIRRVISDVCPSIILNAAAYTAVDQAESDQSKAMRINGEAPGVLAEEARRIGALLVHYSTDYVFDGTKDGAYDETDLPNPLNVYGATKLAGERAIAQVGGAWAVLRTSWVYGMHGKNFLLTMLRLAQQKSELSVVADQFGAPTWSRTIAEMTARMLEQPSGGLAAAREAWIDRSGVYHLTTAGATSWAGFAQAIFAHAGLSAPPTVLPISTDQYPTPARRPHNSRLSNAKLTEVFGIRPPQWDDELGRCLTVLRAAREGR
ncbi:dTDP-4-dehydrorhamnose reductase subunit, NAD(P)-binding, of dTDP-L-rhamnose synthase [Paraburkholderia piptadeniae]|uniref:dTDP-4-dehydrorhamnose reductase n=1 Tax=Paraburkholderia piptadeniae TaxID=1701573 RepID=A0A1N7SRR2_9BURK|nr:dTDP-4-dehydrorhamnose reductase [Paraburkholderia piptadeniae]SIT50123.1 dTDP-4-dehydrorhamnose reductase subunit, NAD(P)-binding, of dTDP-L-rhamnose synthase [Paraburkholderia piptadeniae]